MASTGTYGRHVIAELRGQSFEALNDIFALSRTIVLASEKAGATVVGMHTKMFEPQGCSINITLSESHVAIHTFPELNYASFDAYTCGDLADPMNILKYLVDDIGGEAVYELKVRGLPTGMFVAETGIYKT